MTQYFQDASDLVDHAKDQLQEVKEAYNQSLAEKDIKSALLIKIKNLLENLRSALDFSARGLFDLYGSSSKANPKIYFPYATTSQSKADFPKRLDQCIPGLSAARSDIVAKLESYQHFSDTKNRWLPLFMELTNKNKHESLTPQTRTEARQLRMESGGAAMSLGEGASISIGKGASIQIGGMTIPGGQRISPDSPPLTMGAGKTQVITWVGFHFSHNNEPVLPLLENALSGVRKIVNDLSGF